VERSVPVQPMINFAIHQVRAGAGAGEDFEQMLALLVQAISGEANLVFANPGDWGIDVLVGDLAGQVTIWQAKYFIRGVAKSQADQIRKSFASALKSASAHGYTVARWVLCIPSSMDGPATQWWHAWKNTRQRESGVMIELWDETRLRAFLLTAAAAHVRRHYYNPYRHDTAEEPGPQGPSPPLGGGEKLEAVWRGGVEYRVGHSVYLLYDEPAERPSPDSSWVRREATADLLEPGTGRVRLRQVQVHRRVPAAEQWYAALRAQATLLARLRGRAGLPRLIEICPEPQRVTVVTAHPPGSPWAEVFGPGPAPPDRLTAAAALAAAAQLCAALGVLHESGSSHRALHPGAIFVEGRRCFVRDGGFAAIPPSAGEGAAVYRAPEQRRAPYAAGELTDVYQVAAIVYHTLTSHPPSPAASPPIRATLPGFPPELDRVLLDALDADPARRPASARALAGALRAGRNGLSRGGPW
jgi:hypothetical protein